MPFEPQTNKQTKTNLSNRSILEIVNLGNKKSCFLVRKSDPKASKSQSHNIIVLGETEAV